MAVMPIRESLAPEMIPQNIFNVEGSSVDMLGLMVVKSCCWWLAPVSVVVGGVGGGVVFVVKLSWVSSL